MIKFSKKNLCNGINFTNINDDRFKTMRLSVAFFMPLDKDTASCNGIGPFILRRSCKEYPDFTSLNRKLAKLYGAHLYASVNKMGETQVLSISIVSIDNRYALDNENMEKEIANLLCSVIFNPLLDENDNFKIDDIEQERRQMIEYLDAEYNNKRSYAKIKCLELMCKDEKFSVNCFGDKKHLSNLKQNEVYAAYKKMLSSARIEIMALGNLNSDFIFDIFKNEFSKIERNNICTCKTQIIKSKNQSQEFTEEMDIAQCKLVLGFRCDVEPSKKDKMAMKLMSALFGGTPYSKLFLNVREKMSLCYYCQSSYDRYKDIIFVQSGVEKENLQKAKKEILNQLEEIKNSNFSESDISAAKMSIVNSILSTRDSLAAIEGFYLYQALDETIFSIDETIDIINSINKEDIVNSAKKVTLDTVYSLIGKEEK